MKLAAICTSSLLAVSVSALAIGSVSSVQTSPQDQDTLDTSTAEPPYFEHASFDPHYDPRFTSAPLSYAEKITAMQVLVRTCLSTLSDLSIESWLMHNTLLGWWWGQHNLPWAAGADIQLTTSSLTFLAAYYNMSMFFYQYPDIPQGRHFRLEVNPHCTSAAASAANPVDARWIDLQTGLYINLTALRYQRPSASGSAPMLKDKSGAQYVDRDIFPLWETEFEGVKAMIPQSYKSILADEFGIDALKNTESDGHFFQEKTMEWVPKRVEKEFTEL
ncbi:hypothetical protein BROUX41_006779 [Berkeleyomyces rouxiae]